MGWSVEEKGYQSLAWEEYIEAAEAHYGFDDVANVRYLKREVRANDLIWTRDTRGLYYLGRVTQPWEYLADEDSLNADIVNFCRCKIVPLRVDEVPGKVVACFRPPKTIQAIRDDTVNIYSRLLWNRHSATDRYSLDSQTITDLYAFLDDQATEDAVAVYLQMRGWLLLPKSRRRDTMGYEYILLNRDSLQRAVVQVKTGHSPLNQNTFTGFGEKVFLFQSYGNYTGSKRRDVECIDPDDLQRFLVGNRDLLPLSIKHWVDFVAPQA